MLLLHYTNSSFQKNFSAISAYGFQKSCGESRCIIPYYREKSFCDGELFWELSFEYYLTQKWFDVGWGGAAGRRRLCHLLRNVYNG